MDQNRFLNAVQKAIEALKRHDLISKQNLSPYILISYTGYNGEILTVGMSVSKKAANQSSTHLYVSKNILLQLQYARTKLKKVTSLSGDGNNYQSADGSGFVSIAVGCTNKDEGSICVGVIADILERNKIITFY